MTPTSAIELNWELLVAEGAIDVGEWDAIVLNDGLIVGSFITFNDVGTTVGDKVSAIDVTLGEVVPIDVGEEDGNVGKSDGVMVDGMEDNVDVVVATTEGALLVGNTEGLDETKNGTFVGFEEGAFDGTMVGAKEGLDDVNDDDGA